MPFTPLSAKNAAVRFNTSGTPYALTANKWVVTPKCDELDITNFEGNGFGDWIGGIIDAEFTVEGDWDSANDHFLNPPNLNVAVVISGVKLYVNTVAGVFWNFPSALIVETPMNAAVREKLTFSIRCKSKGSFTSP